MMLYQIKMNCSLLVIGMKSKPRHLTQSFNMHVHEKDNKYDGDTYMQLRAARSL